MLSAKLLNFYLECKQQQFSRPANHPDFQKFVPLAIIFSYVRLLPIQVVLLSTFDLLLSS